MSSRRVADSAASRRVKGRRRRKLCNGKVRRNAETAGLCRTRGQVERSDEAPTASDAERSENQSIYYSVAVAARLSERRFDLRLHSDRRRSAPGRHHATLHRRRSSQCRRNTISHISIAKE